MLEMLGTLFGAIFSGGATGLIGVAIQRFADYKNRKLDIDLERERRETEIAKRKVDAEIAAAEWAGRLRVATAEGEAATDVAESNAFAKTMWHEPERYSNVVTLTKNQQWIMVFLDFVRGIVRPGLTIYLCALTTYVWFQVRAALVAEDLQSGDVLEVWRMVVGTILYLTTTVVLWWFGTRNRHPQARAPR